MNRRQVFGGLAGAALAAAFPETAEGVGRRALPAVGCDPASPGRDVTVVLYGKRFVFPRGLLVGAVPPSGSASRSGGGT